MDLTSEGQVAYLGDVTWQEVPKDEGSFLDFLDNVMTVLEGDEPPPPGSNCGFCKYRSNTRSSKY